MVGMTWKEFKNSVDKALQEKDIDENTEIWYIDISFPDKDNFETGRLGVSLDTCGIAI